LRDSSASAAPVRESANDHRAAIECDQEPVSSAALELGREVDHHLAHPDGTQDSDLVRACLSRGLGTCDCRRNRHKQ
jgi:hypothetical protein